MSIFDKFSQLDPARMRRQIEAAYGSALFNNFSALDPHRMYVLTTTDVPETSISTVFAFQIEAAGGGAEDTGTLRSLTFYPPMSDAEIITVTA